MGGAQRARSVASNGVLSPSLSAKRANERIAAGVAYYLKRLETSVKAAFQDGYAVGTVPPQNNFEEWLALSRQYPSLMQTITNPSTLEPARRRADLTLKRWAELQAKYGQ